MFLLRSVFIAFFIVEATFIPGSCSLYGLRGGEEEEEAERMSRSLGIPVKPLHEAAGHAVTVELKSGELYRGSMIECEDN